MARMLPVRVAMPRSGASPLYSLVMDIKRTIPTWGYKLLLASAAAVWGGSFVVLKDALDLVAPSWLLAIRFGLASLVLIAVLLPRLRANFDASYLKPGIALGLAYGGAYVLQTYGLAYTTPGRNAFLTALYCVLVPYFAWAAGSCRPRAHNLLAAVLAVAGIGFISLGDDLSLSLGLGDWLTLACSVLYAIHMVLVPRVAQSKDVLTLTVVQLATCCIVALACALALDPAPTADVVSPSFIGALVYLVLFASCFSMVAQNVGQANVEPASAALIMSLESVFAVICSVIFYGEEVTPQLALGFALIFAAVLVSEVVAPLKVDEDNVASEA